jgi:hypothetical protein
MLKFYYSGAPNPTKVALFLEETGTPYVEYFSKRRKQPTETTHLGMAESKSEWSGKDFNVHSEKTLEFEPISINRLGGNSKCGAVWRQRLAG